MFFVLRTDREGMFLQNVGDLQPEQPLMLQTTCISTRQRFPTHVHESAMVTYQLGISGVKKFPLLSPGGKAFREFSASVSSRKITEIVALPRS